MFFYGYKDFEARRAQPRERREFAYKDPKGANIIYRRGILNLKEIPANPARAMASFPIFRVKPPTPAG